MIDRRFKLSIPALIWGGRKREKERTCLRVVDRKVENSEKKFALMEKAISFLAGPATTKHLRVVYFFRYIHRNDQTETRTKNSTLLTAPQLRHVPIYAVNTYYTSLMSQSNPSLALLHAYMADISTRQTPGALYAHVTDDALNAKLGRLEPVCLSSFASPWHFVLYV